MGLSFLLLLLLSCASFYFGVAVTTHASQHVTDCPHHTADGPPSLLVPTSQRLDLSQQPCQLKLPVKLTRHHCRNKLPPWQQDHARPREGDERRNLPLSKQSRTRAWPLSLSSSSSVLLSLRGGVQADGEVSALVDDAYSWFMHLGEPSALIAGAVIATIYENIGNGALDILPQDSKFTKFKKRLTTSLLISAFGLEITAIFVTTVTGTMLLSRPLHDMDHLVPVGPHTTPLGFLRDNFEFEYLTARVAYLQGLLNWLAAIALRHIIPRSGESKETIFMNRFISSALFFTIAVMLSFYNNHMSFYHNYVEMLSHWMSVTARRFFFCWPPRMMGIVYIPAILSTIYWGYIGFFGTHRHESQQTNAQDDPISELRKRYRKGGQNA
ncbi:hypothetical protein ACA910_002272 [Epithemia clementina (nom. ined.)]